MLRKVRLRLNVDMGILILRVFAGMTLLYGVLINMSSWEKILEFSDFLNNLGFPCSIWSAITSVAFQMLASISIFFGFKIRFMAVTMAINFVIAIVFVHLPMKHSVEEMNAAMSMLFISFCFIFTGSGKYSLDYFLHTLAKASAKNSVYKL